MQNLKLFLNILSASFGILAATIWLLSALVNIPELTWGGKEQLEAFKKQSKLSARAAICAAITAIIQSVIMFL